MAPKNKLTKDDIVRILRTNDKAVARALVMLHKRQTADEQASATTRVHNGMGFKPCHAYMGTKLAEWYLAKGYLTRKQLEWARHPQNNGVPRIAVYARQLLEIADAKAARKDPPVQQQLPLDPRDEMQGRLSRAETSRQQQQRSRSTT